MIVTVDPALREPPYQQIRLQVVAAIGDGSLVVGSRLPTIRQLAIDLDLAAGTVARAYRELEGDGVIETRGRRGSFVRQVVPSTSSAERARRLDEVVGACVAEARRLGAGPTDIATAMARALVAS